MLDALDLVKSYGSTQAVRGVSFSVERGSAFALLGPNGAGKSTTLHMLVGALRPDGGTVRIDGDRDPADPQTRSLIGICPQDLAIYEELTAAENLAFFAEIQGLRGRKLAQRVDWGLQLAGLEARRTDRAEAFSGGMKRRLNLACAAVHEPKLLLCDEPTVGVDPQSRNHIFESIEALRADGCTLLYTTHYMEEAERLCDRVAIMDHGRVLAIDTVDALIDAHGGQAVVEVELAQAPASTDDLPGTLEGTTLRVETTEPLTAIETLGETLRRANLSICRLRVDRPDLERVFLSLTGRSLRD
ncbi:ABC transporter ATP-binding protein [Paraliomyxa miuraensis]|uniref:ABC transporter ATP-binding protein n=1 Tax=Paraliomyxa miuraensis TaxID=376150 RepID=UPI0022539F49|nr:ABC transporter ATP-binding protein [Paraliomyxa miuraensis]MCX4242934.1 ABC transporter ATP-binding protein [Paraliomyxa miuraensis]